AVPRSDRRMNVLIIDDQVMVATAMKRCLEDLHQVTVLDGAEKALDLLKKGNHFDLILCDIMMPQMTGIEFYTQLQSLSEEDAARVVFMTGGTFTEKAQKFFEQTTRTILRKPV